MFRMIMSRGDSSNTVSLHLPTTPSDIGRTFAKLDAVSTTHSTVMTEFNSPVEGLYQYVESINLDSEEEFGKLHSLADNDPKAMLDLLGCFGGKQYQWH